MCLTIFILLSIHYFSYHLLQLDQRLNQVADLFKMEAENQSFWVGLIEEYLLRQPSVTVRGVPSISEQKSMAAEEKERISQQQTTLGPEGLSLKDKQLSEAMQQNEVKCLFNIK